MRLCRRASVIIVATVLAYTITAIAGCVVLGVSPLPCEVDAACAPGDACVDGHCAPRSVGGEGEGEGDVGEGEGDVGEGEGDVGEGEGDVGEGEGDVGEGEGDVGEGEGDVGEGEGDVGEGEGEGQADYVVDTTGDESDVNPGDDVCATSSGTCSLRAAIEEALQHGIRSIFLPSSIVPVLTNEIAVPGTGATVVLDGDPIAGSSIAPAQHHRFFHVNGGALQIAHLAFANAIINAGDGGALLVDAGGSLDVDATTFTSCSAAANGGAIAVDSGSATVTGSSFSLNTAVNFGGAIAVGTGASLDLSSSELAHNTAGNFAGALYDDGSVVVTTTMFDDNTGSNFGGALYVDCNAAAVTTLTNDAFFDNTSSSGSVAAGCVGSSATLALLFSSIHNASSSSTVFDYDGTLKLGADAIEASAAPFDVGAGGACASLGDNVVHTTSTGGDLCAFGQTGDVAANPLLLDPADNGGPFPSLALASVSPAIDRASHVACPATDQRGFPRPSGAGCDSGAFEAP